MRSRISEQNAAKTIACFGLLCIGMPLAFGAAAYAIVSGTPDSNEVMAKTLFGAGVGSFFSCGCCLFAICNRPGRQVDETSRLIINTP